MNTLIGLGIFLHACRMNADRLRWPVVNMAKSMKTLTNELSRIDAVRLPGWGGDIG